RGPMHGILHRLLKFWPRHVACMAPRRRLRHVRVPCRSCSHCSDLPSARERRAAAVLLAGSAIPMSARLAVTLNALALYGISAALLMGFYWQVAYHELPCPLCLLQRVGLASLAIGPILTIRHGPKPRHYGMVVVAAVLGAVIASRQVLLHIQP